MNINNAETYGLETRTDFIELRYVSDDRNVLVGELHDLPSGIFPINDCGLVAFTEADCRKMGIGIDIANPYS